MLKDANGSTGPLGLDGAGVLEKPAKRSTGCVGAALFTGFSDPNRSTGVAVFTGGGADVEEPPKKSRSPSRLLLRIHQQNHKDGKQNRYLGAGDAWTDWRRGDACTSGSAWDD